ncbi:hypothetical protein GW17_00044810, partial [Ensete ventricosum]
MPHPLSLLTSQQTPSGCSSTQDQKLTPAQGDRLGSRSTYRHPEELAHPSSTNEESPDVHVYTGSTKSRRHLNL